MPCSPISVRDADAGGACGISRAAGAAKDSAMPAAAKEVSIRMDLRFWPGTPRSGVPCNHRHLRQTTGVASA
jgi:hypothetical protein